MRRVLTYAFAYDSDHPEVSLCDLQDIKIQ